MKSYLFFFILAIATFSHAPFSFALLEKKQLWVYTSIYKEFAAPLKKAFEAQHPDIEVNLYQAGSEKIQTKVEAELLAHKPQADVILVSDPFWPHDLERRGLLHSRPKHAAVETNYYSLMILISHKNYPAEDRPKSFKDLTQNRFKKIIQMGSPLESGTMFVAVAYLSHQLGWSYFEKLRDNLIASQGGNSTVIQKVESGEKKIGIVLLENALAAIKRGSPIEIIYPSDGAIPIPSVQVLLTPSQTKNTSSLFADFVLSHDGQQLLRNGYMHSIRGDVAPPDGAKPLSAITTLTKIWTPAFIQQIGSQSQDIKKKFSQLILE